MTDTPYPWYEDIVDNASATVTYFGLAEPGTATSEAKWQILRQTISGNVIIKVFADRDRNFDNIWDNRATLNYS